MEASCSRFTAAEGGTRLAVTASSRNILAVEYSSFISTRLIYENAYKIRGSLFDGQQRSVYVTRVSRVPVVSYELRILTDLAIGSAVKHDDVYDWTAELDKKEVLVCTSAVLKQILEEDVLSMENINVLVLDSCHLVNSDPDLQYIMKRYKDCDTNVQPRILALTYPLFSSKKDDSETSNNKTVSSTETLPTITEKEELATENKEETVEIEKKDDSAIEEDEKKYEKSDEKDSDSTKEDGTKNKEVQNKRVGNTEEIGAYKNLDDFEMYEKLEWKIEELEKELSCQMDIAEDIDGGKRISATLIKPKELIIEYSGQPTTDTLPEEYIELQNFMKETINDALEFIDEHRYDPTEIYGEDLYEEFMNIPDPTLDPRHVFKQFLYLLEQLGPYAADKAAFSLLTKLEKLKIKVPYERHFLLLCLCTSVFVKIRCYADLAFSKYDSDWDKIRLFSTPKVLRFAEILEKFQPPEQARENLKNKVLGNTSNDAENTSHSAENTSHSAENVSSNAENTNNNNVENTSNSAENTSHSAENTSHSAENTTHSAENTSDSAENTSDSAENISHSAENTSHSAENTSNSAENTTDTAETEGKVAKKDAMLDAIERCDFKSLSDRIEDKVNTLQANLKDIDLNTENSVKNESTENETSRKEEVIDQENNENNASDKDIATENNPTENLTITQANFKDGRPVLGFRRSGHRARGRGRAPRSHVCRALQLQQNPDALCGIVFVKEPLVAKILFMLIVDMSRCHPRLSHLCAQYCAVEDPGTEPRECQRQGKKQEDVLKKFRMHECNLLLATSALEEGIDLPRCNLVLRWDIPASYRSYGLCRGRARAARATCALLSSGEGGCTDSLLHNVAVYRELDQIISRKCGCGIQDEPPQSEEDHADSFTRLVKPYMPEGDSNSASRNLCDTSAKESDSCNNTSETKRERSSDSLPNNDLSVAMPLEVNTDDNRTLNDEVSSTNDTENNQIDNDLVMNSNNDNIYCNKCNSKRKSADVECSCVLSVNNSDIPYSLSVNKEVKKSDKKVDGDIASVDLSTAIALINRYCGKLPSDTFTRLFAAWSTELVRLPARGTGEPRPAYICTLRLPLNCPVKYNIVGHPMPTRVLARRMVALQACRILHKSGELDNQLMPIGKENFKAADLDSSAAAGGGDVSEPNDSARPGTTKRRQYYYKRTAWAFTDCQPIIDTSDAEIDAPGSAETPKVETKAEKQEARPGQKRNMLYAIVSTLWCALPERYNTRGRRLHAPQHAQQAVAILMARDRPQPLQIPAFPVYTRSGEVRVSVEYVPDADVRMSPRRGRLVRRFMRFVFADVLRVRRRGMKLQSEGSTHNNYYIVPTIKTTREDGSTKIDIDWSFLELIYQYTEEKKLAEVEKPILWTQDEEEGEDDSTTQSKMPPKERDKNGKVKKMENPLLKPGETFVFDADKYREAVVTPWYRNQDQPQFFLVAEICWNLTPDSEFPSDTHKSFRDYYSTKYGVTLTQSDQPLLDVDHTSARLNLLTPRYVNRKGVALPVSSERTRRAKRDRLDQKQILVGELCRVHPFAAPLWFATVALPCVLYRINALLIADEIRRAVAIDVGLGIPQIDDTTCPGFQWPPLDFGWSLAEVLSTDEKGGEIKKEQDDRNNEKLKEIKEKEDKTSQRTEKDEDTTQTDPKEKTLNDILQEKEVDSGFEIGTWSNDMASSIPATDEYDEYMEPLPSNLTFCTSASVGTNWCDPIEKPKSQFNPSRAYSMADSDCSFMSSDFDTDDSDLNSENSDDDTDTSGFCSSKNSNAAMGVRIEYKTAHEAEAVDLERKQKVSPAPQPDPQDDASDRLKHENFIKSGDPPKEYIEKFRQSVEDHKKTIVEKGFLIHKDEAINEILPDTVKTQEKALTDKEIEDLATTLSKVDFKMDDSNKDLFKEVFPYGTKETEKLFDGDQITLESIEKNKRILLAELKNSLPEDEIKKLNCFSMIDVDIDSPCYVNEKVVNVGFDTSDNYKDKVTKWDKPREFNPYYIEGKGHGKKFDFDYQPDLEGHPGPSPSVILQALTMSNANDGINLERLETIGDSFLKFAITAYLYCAHPTVHEGKLSHMRSKQVSNLNLYRLGRNKRLGARMIASKFEPHDNWLPPCHRAPATTTHGDTQENSHRPDPPHENTGCFIPYNLITQHSIPDKSIADCVEALIGAYLLECGPRGALLFMSWLGIKVLPRHTIVLPQNHPYVVRQSQSSNEQKPQPPPSPAHKPTETSDTESCSSDESDSEHEIEVDSACADAWLGARPVGSSQPRKYGGKWVQDIYGELKAPPSPLLRYIADPEGELEQMLSGYDALERTLQYRFKDRSLLLQALTHASHQQNRLTDCYQRLEFLGDAILDYLITRHLYEDPRRHSPGALTDLRSALVNNTIFATLAARHGFHKYFRHMSPGLNEVLTKYVRIQEENGHSISEEHYLIQEDEMEQAEDVEVPKALGDLFESVAGAIFLDSGMSLGAVWKSYVLLMGAELEAFSAAAPKSPVRELLEAEPDTAKFGKPERLADGRRVRVCVEVFGRGSFKGVGRNYRIAKGTAARCALRHLRAHRR